MDEAQVRAFQDAVWKARDDFDEAERTLNSASAALAAAQIEQGESHARELGVWVGQKRKWMHQHVTVEKIEYNPVSNIYWVTYYIFGNHKLEDVIKESTVIEVKS